MEKKIEELEKKLIKLELYVQQLEEKFEEYKNGEYGTGIFLSGCSEADKEYIQKKAGE